mmetsp:Transcript_41244/g.98949  ORF Transcript_41244/g.98949 Transcript_41244/m.98949 type:complete len:266 (+) Transcript_41244:322-1119(+)
MGRDSLGVMGSTLRQDGRQLHLRHHVHGVVGRLPIGADCYVDPLGDQLRDGAEPGSQLQVRRWAMDNRHLLLCHHLDLLLRQASHVHCDQLVVDQADAVQVLERPELVLALVARQRGGVQLLARVTLHRGLVEMYMDRKTMLLTHLLHPLEGGVGHRIRGMRSDRPPQQRLVFHCLPRREALCNVILGAGAVLRRKLDDHHIHQSTEANFTERLGRTMRKPIHVIDSGGARADALRGGEGGAVFHEAFVCQGTFQGPDGLGQPGD